MKKEKVYIEEVFSTKNPFEDQSIFGEEVSANPMLVYDSLEDAVIDLYENLIPELYEQNEEEVVLMFSIEELYDFMKPYWNPGIVKMMKDNWKSLRQWLSSFINRDAEVYG